MQKVVQKQKAMICLKIAWNAIKNMFHQPVSLQQGVYSSILYVNFHSKMQKCVSTGKKIDSKPKI